MAAEGFRIGAVQVKRSPLPAEALPCGKGFELEALDRHVRSDTEKYLAMFDQAGRKGLDFVLGTEDMQQVAGVIPLPVRGGPARLNLLARYSQTVPGPLCEQIGAIARRHDMHVGACFFERSGRRYYNTAVLMDGRGRLVGKYRKVHLPPQEACVLTAGTDFPVFRTGLGVVGFMICYDIMFPESARCLALNGAELLCHPTAGYGWTEAIGDVQVRARAADNSVAVVVACPHRSQVVNSWGEVLADAGNRSDVIVSARLDPRQPRVFPPGHFHRQMTGIPEIRQELFRERQVRAYGAISAAVPPILAGRKGRVEIYTAARKAAIRNLLAAQWGGARRRRRGKDKRCHWRGSKSR